MFFEFSSAQDAINHYSELTSSPIWTLGMVCIFMLITMGIVLSGIQKGWLSFCIMAVLITNSVCRAKFERASLGKHSPAALSWMFRNSKIPWEILLHKSASVILRRFGITEGSLVIDDSGKKRSKKTLNVAGVIS